MSELDYVEIDKDTAKAMLLVGADVYFKYLSSGHHTIRKYTDSFSLANFDLFNNPKAPAAAKQYYILGEQP